MSVAATIRAAQPDDLAALDVLYPLAFPEEELRPLVHDLARASTGVVARVAVHQGEIVGHVVYTICGIEGTTARVALLGPLAVAPKVQRQGVGTALMRDALSLAQADGVAKMLLLGDPQYYSRLGFAQEQDITTPYPVPDTWGPAWQSCDLADPPDALSGALSGRLTVPEVWDVPAYWAP